MYFPTLINWTSPFPLQELLDGIFHLYSISKDIIQTNSGDPDQTPRSVESNLFAYVPQKNARRIKVNIYKHTEMRSGSVGKVLDSGSNGRTFVTHRF